MKKLSYKEIIYGLPPVLTNEHVISLDLELSNLREEQKHRPAGQMLSLAGCFDGETVYIVFEESEVQEYLDRISAATWVFHNSVFDLGHLRRWATIPERRNMRDTLLIDRIMWSNYYSDFGLQDLVRRYLRCYMDKTVRKEFYTWVGAMTKEQIDYSALDVIGTWLVDKEQQKIISSSDAVIWNNLYNPHVWTVLELGGFKLDVDAWVKLADDNQGIVDEITERLGEKYGKQVERVKYKKRAPKLPEKWGYNEHGEYVELPLTPPEQEVYDQRWKIYNDSKVVSSEFIPFNPNSPAQVKEVLLTQYQIELESTDEDHLLPHIGIDFVKDLLEFRKAEKQVSTYGLKFLKNVEDDERIYSSMNIGLAITGRDSCSAPNLQNQPNDEKRRKCFVAGAGKKLVLYDYSGQEAGIWAYVTQDEKFIDIINHGKKLYIEVARIAFDENIKKGTERYRVIKALVLGLMYGLTPYGFARDNKVEIEVAEDMFNKFFVGFPQSAAYVKKMTSRNTEMSYSVIGRKCHLHPYDRQWKTNALNNPMQATGADMIKLAMKKLRGTDFYKKYNPLGSVKLILQVHDEILSEVDEGLAEGWAEIMKTTMVEVAESLTPGVRGGVSGGIINDWSEKD